MRILFFFFSFIPQNKRNKIFPCLCLRVNQTGQVKKINFFDFFFFFFFERFPIPSFSFVPSNFLFRSVPERGGERRKKRRKKKLRRLIKSTRDGIVSNCIPFLIFTRFLRFILKLLFLLTRFPANLIKISNLKRMI